MIPAALHTVAQTLTAAVAATGRPVLTLFAVQAMVGGCVRAGFVELHGAVEPMISFLAIAVMAVLALVEGIVQHQSELSEALDDVYAQRIGAGASAGASTLMLGAVGAPSGGVPKGELGELIQLANGSPSGPAVTLGAIVVAVGFSVGLGWVRARVLESLRDADMDGIYHWLESGGVVTVLILLPLLPLVALGLVLAVSAGLVAVAVLARTGSWVADRQRRRPCPACAASVRMEASLCAGCGGPLPVVRRLGEVPAAAPIPEGVRA